MGVLAHVLVGAAPVLKTALSTNLPNSRSTSLKSALNTNMPISRSPPQNRSEHQLAYQQVNTPQQNNLAINVFGWDKDVIVHHLSKQPVNIPRINLLLIEKASKFHYTWIKDLNRLLNDQSKHQKRKHFCERCLHGYTREDLLESHRRECRGISQTALRVEIPEKGKNKLAFQNHHKQLSTPFIIYVELEDLTTKIEGPELDLMKSNTRKTQYHEACSSLLCGCPLW